MRRLAGKLTIAAIEHYDLLPKYGYNPDYDRLLRQCECATLSHLKKDCPLGRDFDKGRCPACRGTKPLGADYCPTCWDEMERVIRARAEKVKELTQTGQRGMLL